MKKLNRLALTASMLSMLLAVSACSESEIARTTKPLKDGKTVMGNWKVICIEKVEYVYKSFGVHGGVLSVKFKPDSTVSTCDT